MRIDEIQLINLPDAVFLKQDAADLLHKSEKIGKIKNLDLYYLKQHNHIVFVLANENNDIAAYSSFIERANQVWQEAGMRTYPPFKGQQLIGNLYKFIKERLYKSLQSDQQHTDSAKHLWTHTLPSLGLNPYIYDSQTAKIIDPKNNKYGIEVYPDSSGLTLAELWRYMWIINSGDYYRETDILSEDSILMPWRGLWYDHGVSDIERTACLQMLGIKK